MRKFIDCAQPWLLQQATSAQVCPGNPWTHGGTRWRRRSLLCATSCKAFPWQLALSASPADTQEILQPLGASPVQFLACKDWHLGLAGDCSAFAKVCSAFPEADSPRPLRNQTGGHHVCLNSALRQRQTHVARTCATRNQCDQAQSRLFRQVLKDSGSLWPGPFNVERVRGRQTYFRSASLSTLKSAGRAITPNWNSTFV